MSKQINFIGYLPLMNVKRHFKRKMDEYGVRIEKIDNPPFFLLPNDCHFVADYYCPDNKLFIFFIPEFNIIDFHSQENVYDKDYSFLFVNSRMEVNFYDSENEILSFLTEKNCCLTRPKYDANEIYLNRCSDCGKVTFVNTEGSYACRACGHYAGDGNLIGFLKDILFDGNFNLSHEYEIGDEDFIKKDIEGYKTHKEEYDEYIASEEWYEKRQEVFAKQGYECKICGSIDNLRVHHLNYDNLFHEEDNQYDDLIVLCDDCHKQLHSFLNDRKEHFYDLSAKLKDLKVKYSKDYQNAMDETIYEFIKDEFKDTSKKHALIIPYLKTMWGYHNIKTEIKPYFSAQNLYCRLKNEGKLK